MGLLINRLFATTMKLASLLEIGEIFDHAKKKGEIFDTALLCNSASASLLSLRTNT